MSLGFFFGAGGAFGSVVLCFLFPPLIPIVLLGAIGFYALIKLSSSPLGAVLFPKEEFNYEEIYKEIMNHKAFRLETSLEDRLLGLLYYSSRSVTVRDREMYLKFSLEFRKRKETNSADIL